VNLVVAPGDAQRRGDEAPAVDDAPFRLLDAGTRFFHQLLAGRDHRHEESLRPDRRKHK